MNDKSFDELLNGYENNQLSEEELTRFLQLLQQEEYAVRFGESVGRSFEDDSVSGLADQKRADILFQKIMSSAGKEKVVQMAWYRRRSVRWAVAAAASIILVISLGILIFNKPNEQSIAVRNNKQTDSTLSYVHHEVNTTGKEKRIQLADGSLIVLADKSEITYREPFTDKRDITLTGKAYFKVAKDKTRPFAVVSGDISTIALGTEFTVIAFAYSNQISVALHEGKVVVRSADSVHKKLANELFLLPGDELIYNKKTMLATVKHKTSGEQMVKTNAAGKKGGPVHRPDWYKFNGLPLSEVFDQLSAYYQVDIYYYPSDIQNKYFTGRIEKADSLDNILKDIALLNLLTITKKNGSYIVKKIH